MLFIATLDTGNMSDPPSVALVEADTPEEAIAETQYHFSEEEFPYDTTAEIYKGGLLLKDGVALEWLN